MCAIDETQKVLKCKQAAAPTAAPKATTAAPKKALAAVVPNLRCDVCVFELTQKGTGAGDAITLCTDAMQCMPSPANVQCNTCEAALTQTGVDGGVANQLCTKVFQCTPTTPARFAAAVALEEKTLKCATCQVDIVAKGLSANDALFVCLAVLKCPVVPVAQAAPVALWSSFSNFATLAAGVPFADCSAAGHTLQVTSVALNPNPPQKGQNVAISISGNLAAAVGSATAQLTVSLGAFQVLAQTFQLPAAAAGPLTHTVNLFVPGFAQSGTYTYMVKGVITSGGQQLACITANFNL